MKKFTEKKAEDELEFKKDKKNSKKTSNDIESLDDQVNDTLDQFKVDGEWEIAEIIDVSKHEPEDINEKIVINAELGDKSVKRGDFIYITALIHRKGNSSYYHQTQMGVIKVRVVDIYNNLLVLNNL